ncbi:MAG TPA: hypothetical protein VIC07_06845 [Acidimicrobiia bacterium]|jgi:hypothetical protein
MAVVQSAITVGVESSMSEVKTRRITRFLAVLTISMIGTAPFAMFFYVMGLVVAEQVIYPTAALATSVVAGLVAGWAGNGIAGDDDRTDLNRVVTRNLILGVIPAVVSGLLAVSLNRAIWLIIGVVAFTSLTATWMCFRYRTSQSSAAVDGGATVLWFVGTVVGVGLVIFVASLFGLTGA